MAYVALALQIIFLLTAFALRTLVHARHTGSTGFRAGAQRSPTELFGAGGITAALLLSGAGVVLGSLGVLDPIGFLDHTLINGVGVAASLVGIALVLRAQADMGASWRIGVDQAERTQLVTDGLFRWSRNPVFLGMLIFWTGIALIVPNSVAIVAVFLAVAAVEVQVRMVEEPYLIRAHGATYQEYATSTGRLVPGIGKEGLEGLRGEACED